MVENRKTAPYQLALQIAELVLLNYRPDIKSGSKNLLAIMFDMNVLWEEYVYRIMKRYRPENVEVLAQRSKKFWNNITARPDVVIRNLTSKETFIIDTKWKLVDSNKPSIDDLRQIFAYNHLWKSRKSLLLYPGIGKKEIEYSPYTTSAFTNGEDRNECKVGFINVLEFRDNKERFAEAIFNKFKKQVIK